jgi:hypothetical protein
VVKPEATALEEEDEEGGKAGGRSSLLARLSFLFLL